MLVRWLLCVCCGLSCAAGLVGCNRLPFGNAAAEDDFADFDELDEDEDNEEDDTQVTQDSFRSRRTTTPDEAAPPESVASTELALQLPVGSRFPLIKTIDQRLTQQLDSGPAVGHTHLELRMSLLVEEQQGQARRLGVRYHRVQYSQDLGGVAIQYDSDNPLSIVPQQALAYAGLKNNSFSFWLKPDNRVGELIGFEEFLRRCVAHVPPQERQGVLAQLASLSSEDGIANFIDDSIGLLPNPTDPQWAGQRLQIGSSWSLSEQNSPAAGSGPGTRCLLKGLTPQTAEIALLGQIEPSSYVDDVRQLTLTVRGGQCTGTCVVDRQTGMPTQSRIDRVVEMVARLPDGTEIPQRKEVITQVVAYLEQQTPTLPGVTQTGYQSPAGLR